MVTHSFDVRVACRYGMLEAVLFENIRFWIAKNEANGVHFHDGCYWTYNSSQAFARLFPYASPRSIQRALRKLVDVGLIRTGNYNQSPYDRTLWYALGAENGGIADEDSLASSIGQKCPIEGSDMTHGNSNIVQPIPDIKPDNKQSPPLIPPRGMTSPGWRMTVPRTSTTMATDNPSLIRLPRPAAFAWPTVASSRNPLPPAAPPMLCRMPAKLRLCRMLVRLPATWGRVRLAWWR